jgi:hypothetical protein
MFKIFRILQRACERGGGMTEVVRIPMEDGGFLLVEVGDDGHALERAGRADNAVRSATETLQEALARIQPGVEAVMRQIRELPGPPEKVSIGFGIKFTGEANVVIAKAAAEANFTVSAEWAAPPRT